MKKIFLMLGILSFPFTVNAYEPNNCSSMYFNNAPPIIQESFDREYIKTDCNLEYTNGYTTQGNISLWSAEHLTRNQVDNSEKITRKSHFDNRNPVIKSYSNSGYDKGHMTPSNDMTTLISQKETFTWKNIVPQDHELNNGKWKQIENNARFYASKYGDAYIVTGGFFSKPRTIGNKNVLVPYEIWKAILIPVKGIALVYSCINSNEQICKAENLATFQERTEIIPFPGLFKK